MRSVRGGGGVQQWDQASIPATFRQSAGLQKCRGALGTDMPGILCLHSPANRPNTGHIRPSKTPTAFKVYPLTAPESFSLCAVLGLLQKGGKPSVEENCSHNSGGGALFHSGQNNRRHECESRRRVVEFAAAAGDEL